MAKQQTARRLSRWQQQSKKIAREKATRKRRTSFMRRVRYVALAFVLIAAGTLGILYMTGDAMRVVAQTSTGFWKLTARCGFAVSTLYLEGRGRTQLSEIKEAMQVKKGDSILALPIDEIRARLEKIPSVKTAAVERALPGAVYIRIVEREPIAMWQHKGEITLVDDEGRVMKGFDLNKYKNLLMVTGDDAPDHIAELLALLQGEPDLLPRVKGAMRFGDRRWNIRLDNGIEVRLPEKDPVAAWKRVAELQREQQLLDRDIKMVDLRADDRMYIKTAPAKPKEKEQTI